MRKSYLMPLLIALVSSPLALAHCDTMDGPVVVAAKRALESGDITPVLRWVQPADEPMIKETWTKTLAVRAKGDDARDLADRYFFETLVRVHRAGEGEPYTGLKPAGTPVDPGIRAADHALESGSADEVVQALTKAVEQGVRQRFAAARNASAHADHNVEAGRKAVAAYVQFMHYVEKVHAAAAAADGHHGQPDAHAKHEPAASGHDAHDAHE